MFTAASYHRGVAPEVDALSATMIPPWDARKIGAMKALNDAITKRLDGIILAQTATSVSFVLYLRREPKRAADGMVSLEGFKMRSVPIYDGFLRALGATTITVQVPEIYNALERGLVDGFAFPELFTRPMGWPKFVKYRVYPRFYQLEPCIFISNKALKKLSKEGQAFDAEARAGVGAQVARLLEAVGGEGGKNPRQGIRPQDDRHDGRGGEALYRAGKQGADRAPEEGRYP